MTDDPVLRSWFNTEIEAYLRSVNASDTLNSVLANVARRHNIPYSHSRGQPSVHDSHGSVIYVSGSGSENEDSRSWKYDQYSTSDANEGASSSSLFAFYHDLNPITKILFNVLIIFILLFCISLVIWLGIALFVCCGFATYKQIKRKMPSCVSCFLP
jgi:hypothetical protein